MALLHYSLPLLMIMVTLILPNNALSATSRQSRDLERFICQKNMLTQLDNYLNDVQILNGKRKFPESIPQLREACKVNKNVIEMITTMANKCMTGFLKNIMQVTIYSIRKSQKLLCRPKPTKEMEKFVAAGKCVNNGRQLFRKCLRTTANNILASKQASDNKKLPIICCEIVRAKQCLMKEAKKVPECTYENVDVLQNRFNSISLNGINIACGNYNEETDKCSKLVIPKGDFVSKVEKDRSFVMTLLEFIESLPQGDIVAKDR